MKNKAAIIVCILLIGGALYVANNFNNTSSTSNNSNSSSLFKKNVAAAPAIDFKLKDLDGNDVSLKDLKGKKVFLNFWATWCPPCRGEMPELEKIYEETKGSDLVIITVNLGEDRQTVKSFMDSNKYNFKVLLDSSKEVSSEYQVSAIPTSFFIDKNGKVINKNIGAMSYEEMMTNIKALDSK